MNRIQLFFLTGYGILAEYLLYAAAGACFTLAFPGCDWSWLIWIGAVPPCIAVLKNRPGAAFRKVYIWSWFWNFTVFFWLREIEKPIPFGLASLLACFPAIWAAAASWMRIHTEYTPQERLAGSTFLKKTRPFANPVKGLLFLFGAAGLWCLQEWVRSWIFTGLPWNLLAAPLWQMLPVIQICEFTGMYGVSFVVIVLNLAIAMTVFNFRVSMQKSKTRPWPLFAAFLLLAIVICYGVFLLKQTNSRMREPIRFSAGFVQCDLPQRRIPVPGQTEEALNVCTELSEQLLKENAKIIPVSLNGKQIQDPPLSVILWPETAVPVPYRGNHPFSEAFRKEIGRMLRQYHVPFLVGSLDFELAADGTHYDLTNSALLLKTPDGEIADRYSKIHLVPFGEYVPYGDKYPQLNRMLGMGRNLQPGRRFHPVKIAPGIAAGFSICYECVFPFVSRGHARNGATLLAVLADDTWYPTSNEPEQIFSNAVFRAVETRLPLIRCGNASHTAWIDPTGVIRKTALPGMHDRGRAAVRMTIEVPKAPRLTFYSRYGDLFMVFCGFLAFLAATPAYLNWREFRLAQKNPAE